MSDQQHLGPGPQPPGAHNLLYINNNPNPATICPQCLPLIGEVFVPGTEPPLPAHRNCYCDYLWTKMDPTGWTAAQYLPPGYHPANPDPDAYTLPPGCMGWLYKIVDLLRAGLPIPFALLPLLALALALKAKQDAEREEDVGAGVPPVNFRPSWGHPFSAKMGHSHR